MTPALWLLSGIGFVLFCWAVGEVIELGKPLNEQVEWEQARVRDYAQNMLESGDDAPVRPRIRAGEIK